MKSVILSFYLLQALFQTTRADSNKTINILHLGDSYSAGVGGRSDKGLINYSGVIECWRSKTSWGEQYADEMSKTYNINYVNRACGGGIMENSWEPRRLILRRPRLFCSPKWREKDDMYFERVGLFRCGKFVRPQLDLIDESVDLLFFSMGGNDSGFARIVASCLVKVYLADARACKRMIDRAYEQVETAARQARKALLEMWDRMGQSGRVVYFGYPHIVQNVSNVLRDPLTGLEIDAPQAVREFTAYGNSQVQDAVRLANSVAGVEFAEWWGEAMDLFEGHEPDPYNFRLNTDRWLYEIRARVPFESWHPNPKGHEAWGAAVVESGLFGLEN